MKVLLKRRESKTIDNSNLPPRKTSANLVILYTKFFHFNGKRRIMQRNPCVQMTWVHPPISQSSTFPKGRDGLTRCLFGLFNFLTMHRSPGKCAQVLSLPHCSQTWLPLHAFLNDKATGPKHWYVERKPKLTVGGGRQRKALPISPSP